MQKCIYLYTSERNQTNIFFDYLINFYEYCYKSKDIDGKTEFTIECGKAQMDRSGLPVSKIEKCYAESFIIPNDMNPREVINYQNVLDNKIFDNDNEMRNKKNARIMPSIFINDKQIWGTNDKKEILEAICSGLLKKPEICFKEGGFSNPPIIRTRTFWKFFLLVMGIVMGISLIIFIICRKFMKNQVTEKLSESDIDLKVNTVVTSYLALKDKN